MKNYYTLLLCLLIFTAQQAAVAQGLVISKILANPAGTDSPFEYAELVATTAIDFSITPYSVVFSNNGTATVNGWIAGGGVTYGFSISTGKVAQGDVVYVGGSSMAPSGIKLRVINTSTTSGDRFGNPAAGGVLGNGGTNADGVAVFAQAIDDLTNASVPVDAVFFGTGPTPGGAVVSGGAAGYQLPVNDLYSGGKIQTNSYIGPDPGSDDLFILSGTFNLSTKSFSIPRTLQVKNVPGGNPSGLPQNILFTTGSGIIASIQSLQFTTPVETNAPVQSYWLVGNGLASDLTVSFLPQFQGSANASGPFADTLIVPVADFKNDSMEIFVRFSPSVPGTFHGQIVNSTSGAFTLVAVTGTASSVVTIAQIQGKGDTSLLKGQTIFTEGVVTADFQGSDQLKGFYLQDSNGDGNDSTSEGIFVFDNLSRFDVKPGYKISLQGTVDEYNTSSELKNIVSLNILDSGVVLTPLTIQLPAAKTDFLERYEGMLVSFSQTLTVTDNYNLGRYAELTLSSSGRQEQPTNFIDPDDANPAGTNSNGNSNVGAINTQIYVDSLNRIVLDDGSNVQNPPVVPFLDPSNNTLRIGSTISGLAGILDQGFGSYRIEVLSTTLPFNYAPRPAVPGVGKASLKVGSMNIENFFNGDGKGGGFPTPRGATTYAEFLRQRDKTVSAIFELDADVMGLMEVENDGDGDYSAIADLVNALNVKAGGVIYDYIRDPKGSNGNSGTDAIKPASIYKIAKVSPVGSSYADTTAINNRPPLGQAYMVNTSGEKFTLIVNHLKSKGCDGSTGLDIDQNDGQGCWNDTRKQQAQQLLKFIAKMQAISLDSNFISVGDYNSYEEEDPIDVLRAAGLINLISHNYSYVFDGYSGSLDHAFVNPGFLKNVTGADKWHINADEPVLKDYSQQYNPPYVYAPDAFRASDHDPVLIGLELDCNFITLDLGNETIYLCENTTLLLNTPEEPGYRYEWFKDGVRLDNDTNFLAITTAGEYKVIIRTPNPCPLSDSVQVVILPAGTGSCGVVSAIISGETNQSLRVNPNPASDEAMLQLDSPSNEGLFFEVRNALGLMVLQGSIPNGARSASFRTAELPAGTYLVLIRNSGNSTPRISSSKLLIIH